MWTLAGHGGVLLIRMGQEPNHDALALAQYAQKAVATIVMNGLA